MRMILSLLLAFTVTAPAFAYTPAEARAIARHADRLANAADRLANQADDVVRLNLANNAAAVAREAQQLAGTARYVAGTRDPREVEVRRDFRDARAAFQRLSLNWQRINPTVISPRLRQAWQQVDNNFVALRNRVRD